MAAFNHTTPAPYASEHEGQLTFFSQFGIDADAALAHNTDGVHKGNLLEFKTSISDLNAVLFQAVKYLSKLRVRGVDVPAHIVLVDLNRRSTYRFSSADYDTELHVLYTTAASRENKGFQRTSEPETVDDYESPVGAATVVSWLRDRSVHPVRITADCVVAWAERYYREVPGSTKNDLLADDPKRLGELHHPRHFAGKLVPYDGDSYEAFTRILDRLNDKLKKIELGAFYTPDAYVAMATELVRKAIARVPSGNDYVIIDRCAGTGNLERFLTDDELSHVIVNTVEEYEYLELAREFGDRVRAVVPPTHTSGDPALGLLRNGDALTESFVRGDAGASINQYLNDATCTVILYENPPYGEVASIEAHQGGRPSFGWKGSWVRAQMAAALRARAHSTNGVKATNDLASVFIWSAFEYYLRQRSDSYVVFSPAKYFKSQALVPGARFVEGFLVNRKRFHTNTGAGIALVLWANDAKPGDVARTEFPLTVFDIDDTGNLAAGSARVADGAPTHTTVRTTTKMLSSLYVPLPETLLTHQGVFSEKNGTEARRTTSGTSVDANEIVGYLIAQAFSFENADLMTQLTRVATYNGNGFYLTRDNYLSKLPLFVVGRYPAARRWWERGVVNRCADNGDNFSHDAEFTKQCLIYTALSRHNKCRSFTGSNKVAYRNELCFDEDTLASEELARRTLTPVEDTLVNQ